MVRDQVVKRTLLHTPARRWPVLSAACAGLLVLAACELTSGSSGPVTTAQAQPQIQAQTQAQAQARVQAPLPVLSRPPGSAAPRPSSAVPSVAETGRTLPSLVPFLTGRAGAPLPQAERATPAPAPPLPPSQSVRTALLLPLSGQTGTLGRAMLAAAELALFDFADNRFELLIHDTAGTPSGAEEAARLAIGDGSRLILGPLLAPNVRAITPSARAAGVPVIAFSSDRTITGDGVYTLGFFPESEVVRVARYATAKGIKRFAALVPDNIYGRAVAGALKQTAEAAGAELTRLRYYNPRGTDFAGDVQEISDYGLRRQQLTSQLAQLQGRDDEVSTRTRTRLEKLQTLGELPFDALLLADGGRRLQSIAALLPFYDVDPKKVQILGTGQWDEDGLGAEPALLGGWFAAPEPAARRAFIERFKKAFGEEPPRLATLTYDAVALAAVLARRAQPFSEAALTQASGFAGRDGIFRFARSGTVERGLAVLKVDRRTNRVIQPAPKAFQ